MLIQYYNVNFLACWAAKSTITKLMTQFGTAAGAHLIPVIISA